MKNLLPRIKHVCLKKFREIAGITQSELAEMVGVSNAAIIAIEAGNLPMSVKMARRIMSSSGVLPRSLLDPKGRPLDLDSRPYTREHYAAFRDAQKLKFDPNRKKILLPKGSMQRIESALAEHRALSTAAAINGKLRVLDQLWMEWLVSTLETLNLAEWFIVKMKTINKHNGKVRLVEILQTIERNENPATHAAFKNYLHKVISPRKAARS
jgi:DNA-binding XRE family transcriptional regulator